MEHIDVATDQVILGWRVGKKSVHIVRDRLTLCGMMAYSMAIGFGNEHEPCARCLKSRLLEDNPIIIDF